MTKNKKDKHTKEDISLLLQVSATTFAIFVSLGSAIPILLTQGTEKSANLFTNSLWLIGVGINWLVVLYPLFLFMTKKSNNPPDSLTTLAYLFLIISYFIIILALIFFTQVIL